MAVQDIEWDLLHGIPDCRGTHPSPSQEGIFRPYGTSLSEVRPFP